MDRRPSATSSAALLIAGIAAGAAVTWLLSSGAREKLTSGAFGELLPKDLVDKATQALQDGRNKVIAAVDDASSKFRT